MSGAAMIAIVPVKGLASAKSRLAERLTAAERTRLVEILLDHVLDTLWKSVEVAQCFVVSPEPAILERARQAGARAIAETTLGDPPGGPLGHNPALELTRAIALEERPESLLVLSADLPLLQARDVWTMTSLGSTGADVVIAPDRHGQGTNALLLRPPTAIPFRFGPDSCKRHEQEAEARGLSVCLYQSPGTAFDIDVVDDLDALRRVALEFTADPAPPGAPP